MCHLFTTQMKSTHAWMRTIVVLMVIPLSFVMAAAMQNIQTILFTVGILYVLFSSTYLIFILRTKDTSVLDVIESSGFVLRRGGAWALLVYMFLINLIITETFIIDLISFILVYMGGILDQAILHWETKHV